jgi:hypothetical protein
LDPNPTRAIAEIFDAATLTWQVTGSMNQARYEHTLNLLADGSVLASGGAVSTQLGALSTAERYQPGVGEPPPVQVTINSNVAGANFIVGNSGCNAGTYQAAAQLSWNIGANCAVTAVAPSGYSFGSWNDGSSANPRSFVAPGTAVVYTATFKQNPPAACTYAISRKSQSISAADTTGSVRVNSSTGCAWTASSNALNWLKIISGANGTGQGTVTYEAKKNTGASRTGTLTIAGQTFTVTQKMGR